MITIEALLDFLFAAFTVWVGISHLTTWLRSELTEGQLKAFVLKEVCIGIGFMTYKGIILLSQVIPLTS